MSYVKTIALENSKPISILKDLAIAIAASFGIGLLAQAAIPLPFTPVPIATQNSFVILLAALLGAKRGAAAVFAFLAQGAMGFPVFAGGVGGAAKLLGPTGGYLIGYLAAAFLVGMLMEKAKEKSVLKNFLFLAAGHLTIYLFGAAYLSTFIGFEKALLLGVVPFLIGDFLKMILSLKILNWIDRIRNHA